MIMFDCEVFKEDWMFVFIDVDTDDMTVIINDREELINYYDKHKDCIFGGYNARSYDQYIFKAILLDEDPKKVNDYIIVKGMNGGSYSKQFRELDLLIYDCMIDKMKSLKQLEGFMGNDIRETTVSFDIDRKLTDEELEEVKKYCIHDVKQTIEVFKRQPEELESQTSLVEAFELPKNYMNKTKAQLSAIILGAKNEGNKYDEYNISFPDTFVIGDRYKYIFDWYNIPINRNYKMSLTTNVMGVPHIFAWGGLHGAISNYVGEGFYVMSDVASLYPSIMLEYGYLSRNVPEPDKYRRIRDKRLELKKAKNPMQLPYKLVLNGTFGASKDKYNQLFDPLMANNVCIAGQLLLLDLIEKIEIEFGNECELIQSNTDGILVKLPSKDYYDRYLQVCEEWSKRVRLDLEHDIYIKVYQKDVNNYIIIDEKGKYKSKGAYVKKLNDLDYDLPIVNKALINKLVHNMEIEDTVNSCDELKEFQKIVKVGRDYECAMFGDKVISERVLRVFASTDETDSGIFKYRNEKADKVGNTPEVAFIYNDNVNGLPVPSKLDKQWYIDLANKRLADFLDREVVNDGLDVYELIDDSYTDFTSVIVDLLTKSIHKPKDIKMLISIGYFKRFGSTKKLLTQYELYQKVHSKKSLPIETMLNYGLSEDELSLFGNVAKKNVTKLDGQLLYKYLVARLTDEEYNLQELVRLHLTNCGKVNHIEPTIPLEVMCVTKVHENYGRYEFELYRLQDGKSSGIKVDASAYTNTPINDGDIIKVEHMTNGKYGMMLTRYSKVIF